MKDKTGLPFVLFRIPAVIEIPTTIAKRRRSELLSTAKPCGRSTVIVATDADLAARRPRLPDLDTCSEGGWGSTLRRDIT
jgi:hypothetical protein